MTSNSPSEERGNGEIFVSLINGKSVMGEGRRNPPRRWSTIRNLVRNEISRERGRKRARGKQRELSLFDDPTNHGKKSNIPGVAQSSVDLLSPARTGYTCF